MASLNLDLNYFEHPKVMRLIGLLGNDADVIPIRLWAYCGKFLAEDGRLAGYSEAEIERIVGWRGTKGACIEALVKLRFLEKDGDTFFVHDWLDHAEHIARYKKQGKALKQRQIAERQRLLQEEGKGKDGGKSVDSSSRDEISLREHLQDGTREHPKEDAKDGAQPRQGSAFQDITKQAIAVQGSTATVAQKPANANAGAVFLNVEGHKIVYQLSEAEFEIWRNRVAAVIKSENEGRPNNRFEWTGSDTNSYSKDWWLLNNRLFSNADKQRYLNECRNILDDVPWWCDAVELSIIVAVRRSETVPVKSSMAFVLSLLKNAAGLCADVAEGVLRGYTVKGRKSN